MPGLYTRTDYAKLPKGFPAQLVEGLSPSTALRDRRVKRARMLDAGAEEV